MNLTTMNRVATLEHKVATAQKQAPLIFRVLKAEENSEKTWASCLLKSGRVYMDSCETHSEFVSRCEAG